MYNRRLAWWKQRSTSKRSLTVNTISGVLSYITLAVNIGVVSSNAVPYNVYGSTALAMFIGEISIRIVISETVLARSLVVARAGEPPAVGVQTFFEGADDEDVCVSLECNNTASSILKNMNSDVDPCDDFYEFACGNFEFNLNVTSVRHIISAKLVAQERACMESPIEPTDPKPFRLLKKLYESCTNETAIEDQGSKTLHKVLKKLGGWPVLDGEMWNDTGFDWKQSMYKFSESGYGLAYLMSLHVGFDEKNKTKTSIYLEPPILGIQTKFLSRGFDDKMVQAYYRYMVDMAVLLGAERENASMELKDSLIFEMKLANLSSTT